MEIGARMNTRQVIRRIAVFGAAGLALSAITVSAGRAGERFVRCRIESGGQVAFSGRCRFFGEADGSFSLEKANRYEPLFGDILDVSVSIVSPDVAEVSGLTSRANASRWGEARRSVKDRACWDGEDFQVCAY